MRGRYHPAFNVSVYGPAEARAERYWDKRLQRKPAYDDKVQDIHTSAVDDLDSATHRAE